MINARIPISLACTILLLAQSLTTAGPNKRQFHWPEGKLGAVTLSYDDAIPSHFEQVAPALEKAGLRATF